MHLHGIISVMLVLNEARSWNTCMGAGCSKTLESVDCVPYNEEDVWASFNM